MGTDVGAKVVVVDEDVDVDVDIDVEVVVPTVSDTSPKTSSSSMHNRFDKVIILTAVAWTGLQSLVLIIYW